MKIALLTDGIYPFVIGGMQKHSFYLAKYFALHKIEVELYHVLTADFEEKKQVVFSAEEKKYIRFHSIPFPVLDKLPGHYIRESYAYSAAIVEELKSNPVVDFVYVQGLSGMKLLENRGIYKAPVGVNFHGLEMFQPAANFKTKLEQYFFKTPVLKSLKNADVVFSLGGKLTTILKKQGVSRDKILQIPIGIDRSWIRESPLEINEKRKFVFIGRYERRKGIEELTSVLKRLIMAHDFSFEFIGEVPERKQIKAGCICYHGKITDAQKIKNILSESDILVCPSYSEGMPTVILEAMASGMAIIASDVGAVSEQVNDENGILVQPGNTGELESAMLAFMKMNDQELCQMKKNGISRIKEDFLWETIIVKTIESIAKVA
jgi:glycosyltransferase involved in cell wall biosynthesis